MVKKEAENSEIYVNCLRRAGLAVGFVSSGNYIAKGGEHDVSGTERSVSSWTSLRLAEKIDTYITVRTAAIGRKISELTFKSFLFDKNSASHDIAS